MQLTDRLAQQKFHPILPAEILHGRHYVFQLAKPSEFSHLNPKDTQAMTEHSHKLLQHHQAVLGIGQYGEQRQLYEHALFEDRCIHLGIDLTAATGTVIFAPMAATVHSFKNNNQPGDYGATIILEHQLEGCRFYTLYGHLSLKSLDNLEPNKSIAEGQQIGEIGSEVENGGWPPHLHFQIIIDINDHQGDYPGVCSLKDKKKMLKNCPNPNLMLGLKLT